MKTKYTVALSMLAGAALGAVSVGGLYAQGKAPGAVVVLTFTDIPDPAGYKEQVLDKAQASLVKSGGQVIARANRDGITMLRPGDTPFPVKRYVILGFDDLQKAQDWYNSAEQKPINAYVDQHTKGRIFALKAGVQ
ncbi:MAG TPA: DUF1330 domain-containing protein [Xanthobacteraceae bacterium]|nr:DUF1330 domain-containing protein [Xanthobacteraceae bacterium]